MRRRLLSVPVTEKKNNWTGGYITAIMYNGGSSATTRNPLRLLNDSCEIRVTELSDINDPDSEVREIGTQPGMGGTIQLSDFIMSGNSGMPIKIEFERPLTDWYRRFYNAPLRYLNVVNFNASEVTSMNQFCYMLPLSYPIDFHINCPKCTSFNQAFFFSGLKEDSSIQIDDVQSVESATNMLSPGEAGCVFVDMMDKFNEFDMNGWTHLGQNGGANY